MPDQVSSNPNRSDVVGRPSPESVEHDFEQEGPGVQRSEELKNCQRMPRLGNEEDKPYNDALGG